MSNRVCKGKDCKKKLPDGYKGKYCESCENKRAQNMKKGVKTGTGILGVLGAIVLFIRRK